MERLSARNCRLTLACVFAILTLCGCSPGTRIDSPAIADKIRKTDPQVKKFLDIFPKADVSLDTIHRRGELSPDQRNQQVRLRNELTDGYAVTMLRSLRVESDGVTFDFVDEGQSWQYYLGVLSADSLAIRLNEAEFDALLAARGDLGSLKPFGMDFSLSPTDVKKVIGGVRELYRPAGKLHEVFPDAWTQVRKPSFKQRGRFSAVANLGDGVQLSVRHEIRVAADGFSVELVAEPNKDISGQMSLYISSAGPGGSSMDLTPDQFDKLLAAKGAPAVVQQVWSERPPPERKPKRSDEVLPDGTIDQLLE